MIEVTKVKVSKVILPELLLVVVFTNTVLGAAAAYASALDWL